MKDGSKKYFRLYNIFAERFERKLKKKTVQEEEKQAGEESDAFELHPSANYIVYCQGSNLVFHSLKIPEALGPYIMPKYQKTNFKENPAKLLQQKEELMHRTQYITYKINVTKPEHYKDICIQMVKKMQQTLRNKALLKANKEYLHSYKCLLKMLHENKYFKTTAPVKFHKVCQFDELVFTNDLHKIKFMQLPRDPENNYLLLAIDGTIYKYDLSSRDCTWQFKSNATRSMQFCRNDGLILASDANVIKLWELPEGKQTAGLVRAGQGEAVPDLFSMLEVEAKMTGVYATKTEGETYFIAVQGQSFSVFKNQLEEIAKQTVGPLTLRLAERSNSCSSAVPARKPTS